MSNLERYSYKIINIKRVLKAVDAIVASVTAES